jgi:monofunctional biosynthetic peptidoglycan transglycosylase
MKFIRKILRWLLIFWGTVLLYSTVFPPVSTLMLARLVTLRPVDRTFVPISRISPHLTHATIAAEDGKFCTHRGIDWQAMRGAVAEVIDIDGDPSHGASTVTMQTVKNLFLWHNFSYLRKPIEIPLALLLEVVWSKRRIMETYLNTAEFGRGIFGAEAAARYYFGKSAANLSLYEASLLAAALPNPTGRNPARPSANVAAYAGNIRARVNQGVTAGCTR